MKQKYFLRVLGRTLTFFVLLLVCLALGIFSFERHESKDEAMRVLVKKQATNGPVKLLFVGDMMFDREVRTVSEARGEDYAFTCADNTLKRYDAVVGNLEGPITHNASKSTGSIVGSPNNFVFTFPPTTAERLRRHNISIVNLGNNHILNFGMSGLIETRTALDQAGVGHFGGIRENSTIYRTNIHNRNFSFVSFNEFGGDSASATAALIREEKTAGNTVILFAHWGDEYSDVPKRVRKWTQLFIESGADAVVGTHPHVVQGWGKLNEKPYYYSLGNFIFDQYWNEDVSNGLAVEMIFKGDAIETREFTTHIFRDGRTCIQPPQEGA